MFVLLFFFIFVLGLVISIFEIYKNIIVGIIIVTLTIFAGTRIPDIDNDYNEYAKIFSNYKTFSSDHNIPIEPSTYIAPALGFFLFGKAGFIFFSFLFFAFFAVYTKIKSLAKHEYFLFSLLLYMSFWFFTQEMITIRAGVACGIFLWSIDDLIYKRDKTFFLKIAFAFIFHYSSIIFLFIWVILRIKTHINYYFVGIFISLIIAVLKINLLVLTRLDLLIPKVQLYLALQELTEEESVNLFSFRILFSILISLLFLIRLKSLKENIYFMALFKIHLLSLILFFALSPVAMVFSLRIFDMLSIVQLLLYPLIIILFKEKFMGYTILLGICIINLWYTISLSGLFKPYGSWLFN